MSKLPEGQVLVPNAILGYPKLYAAEKMKKDPDSKPRFGCQLYLPKSDKKTIAALKAEIERLETLHLDGKKVKSSNLFIKDGDGEDGDEFTKGHWVISANRAEKQGRPQVVDRHRKAIDSTDPTAPYAGCVVNGLIKVYFQETYGKIPAALEVIQFVKDGEPFGAKPADVDSVMPDLGDEDEDI